jgi:hypothetical protein
MILRQAQHERHFLTAPLWRWTGGNGVGWFFASITGEVGHAIAATALMHRLENGRAKGFGSVKVIAQVGSSRWATSVFPSKEVDGYLLPVKAAVRKAEGLTAGDEVELVLEF